MMITTLDEIRTTPLQWCEVQAVKQSYTELINLLVKDEKEKLTVFNRDGVYLPMKKIGKNNPKAEEIAADNQFRREWNSTVDQA